MRGHVEKMELAAVRVAAGERGEDCEARSLFRARGVHGHDELMLLCFHSEKEG
jgi:hypothetical protein